jgi:hypothetical protein
MRPYFPGMDARFSIDVDPRRDLVRITLAGFFKPADVERFLAARDEAHRKLACAPNAHVTLADVREMAIQSQDAVAAFGALLADPRHRSRRLAFVFASSLARNQLLRAAEGRGAKLFGTIEEAEAWLLAPDETVAAA